jgi:parallel beta-helix repeat protein
MDRSLFVFASVLFLGGSLTGGMNVLVVDNDGMDCPNADFMAIQDAVTAAAPGAKILVCAGTYHERVLIDKSGLTLEAQGAPGEVIVDADLIGNGITVSGASDVTIEGFTVVEGHDNDIMLVNANRNTLRKNVLTAAVHDPINLVNSDDNLIEHNTSIDNLAANACGVNLAAGSDRNIVRHNLLINNEWGIQIAGSADNVIFHNEARRNRGNGIRNVANSSGTIIEDNRAFENGFAPNPATTGTTNAGIRIASGSSIVVARNHAFGNLAVDLRLDAAAATFDNNHCNTSSPPGLCAHTEGKGH